MSLIWAPGRQQSFLCRRCSLRIGLSAPFSKESPTTITHLFSFDDEVLMLSEVWLHFGNTTTWGEPSSPPLSSGPCRALYLFRRGSWGGRGISGRVCLHCRAGDFCHCPTTPHFSPLFLGGGEDGGLIAGTPLSPVCKKAGCDILYMEPQLDAKISGPIGFGTTYQSPSHTPL